MSNPNEGTDTTSERDPLELEHETIVDLELDLEEPRGDGVRGGCIITNAPNCRITGGN